MAAKEPESTSKRRKSKGAGDDDVQWLQPGALVMSRVEQVRRDKGIRSRAELVRLVNELGVEMSEDTYFKLCSDERKQRNLRLSEFLALAAALDVAPVFLLSGRTAFTRLQIGSLRLDPRQMWIWLRGQWPLRDTAPAEFFSEAPAFEQERLAKAARKVRERFPDRGLPAESHYFLQLADGLSADDDD